MGLAGYLDSLNLDPTTREKLASYTSDEPPASPPPPFGAFSGDSRREDVHPDIHSRPATITPHDEANPGAPPGPGLNWKRAGDRLQAAGEAVGKVLPVGASAPGEAVGRYLGKAGTEAVTGKQGPATEDTGEGISQEMIDNRNRVAKERGGEGGGEEEGGGGPRVSQATPGRYVPAHWQDTNRSMTTQHGIDESKLSEGQKQRAMADNYGQWANDDIKKANEKEALGEVAHAAAVKDTLDAYAARAQRIENEKRAYTIREHEKLDALNVAAQAQVDPEAAKGSMGAQILAALSVGLGQFGASLNGGTNTALQIVNGNIDRRIAAQQSNINNAHKSLANEQSLYKDNLAAFGDKERAALATKMQYLDQAKAVLDQQYAGAKSNRNDAQYHAMAQALADKRADVADQFGIRTADQIATTGSQHFVPGQMVGGSAGPTSDLPNVVTVNGVSYQLPNEKEHGKAVDKIQIIGKLQDMNNQALAARAKLEKLNAVTDRTAYLTELGTLKRLEERKASLMSTDAGQGVLRDSEYARSVSREGFFTEGVGGWNEVNPAAGPTRTAANNNIRRQTAEGDKDMKRFVEAAGGRIVHRGYATTQTGQLAPVAKYTGQDTSKPEALPPRGARAMKSDEEHPTAEASAEETTDFAPRFDSVAAPSAGRGKGDGKGPKVKGRK